MYPQSMFFSRNKKNNVYPCEHQFYYINVGFTGVKLYTCRHVFVMLCSFYTAGGGGEEGGEGKVQQSDFLMFSCSSSFKTDPLRIGGKFILTELPSLP